MTAAEGNLASAIHTVVNKPIERSANWTNLLLGYNQRWAKARIHSAPERD
jgi:hypothetical protein